MNAVKTQILQKIDNYKLANKELFAENAEFKKWFEKEYIPVTGGWQY